MSKSSNVITVAMAKEQGVSWKAIRDCAEWNKAAALTARSSSRNRLFAQAKGLYEVADILRKEAGE